MKTTLSDTTLATNRTYGTAETTPQFTSAEMLCGVVSNDWVNDEYKHLILEAPELALTAKPGQFFHLKCPKTGGKQPYLRRPMSIYRVCGSKRSIEFLYKVQGLGTTSLASLTPGQQLDIFGPVGQGFNLPTTKNNHVLIVARGVGLATMAPLAETAVKRGNDVTAILSARTQKLIMSSDYLRAIGANVIEVNDQDGSSDVKKIEDLIRLKNTKNPIDYMATCGSNRLLTLTRHLSSEWQIKSEVAVEQLMGCALGMCFACVKPFIDPKNSQNTIYRRVCWDGPVFQTQETVSW